MVKLNDTLADPPYINLCDFIVAGKPRRHKSLHESLSFYRGGRTALLAPSGATPMAPFSGWGRIFTPGNRRPRTNVSGVIATMEALLRFDLPLDLILLEQVVSSLYSAITPEQVTTEHTPF